MSNESTPARSQIEWEERQISVCTRGQDEVYNDERRLRGVERAVHVIEGFLDLFRGVERRIEGHEREITRTFVGWHGRPLM